MKVLVGAFNQEKALVGAFSVIVKTGCGTDGSICGTNNEGGAGGIREYPDIFYPRRTIATLCDNKTGSKY